MALIVPNHISYCGCIRISYYHQAQQTVLMAYILFLDSSNAPVNIPIAIYIHNYIYTYIQALITMQLRNVIVIEIDAPL